MAIVTERFGLNWVGRAEAESDAAAPPRGALVPAPEQSVLFDQAPHRFIEGDNLAVLKRLRETHAGAVQVIYIDPPYNT
ncbi:MAG: site-specific DNA-methyltransferase, partial [Candidatus Sericytochromatia bacterium]